MDQFIDSELKQHVLKQLDASLFCENVVSFGRCAKLPLTHSDKIQHHKIDMEMMLEESEHLPLQPHYHVAFCTLGTRPPISVSDVLLDFDGISWRLLGGASKRGRPLSSAILQTLPRKEGGLFRLRELLERLSTLQRPTDKDPRRSLSSTAHRFIDDGK